MMPNIHAGRLERRVRRVVRETMPGIHGFCSFFPFGAIREVPLLRRVNVGFGRWQTPSSCLSRITPQGGSIRATLAPSGLRWLHRPIAPALFGPAGQAQHGNSPGHRQHGINDDDHLVQRAPIQVWTQSA